jgi:group I intron endonuclease
MKIFYLYRITNTVNGKIYIGQTINPGSRWYSHKKEANRENPRMVIARAIKKYGSSGFLFELIACCHNQGDANETEAKLVRQYDSQNSEKGYNIAPGGMNAPKSEEWKRKVSEKLMGHKVSRETRDKVSKGNTGKKRSDEFKKNVGNFWRGRERSEEHRQNLSESLKGNTNSIGSQRGKTWKIIDGKRVWTEKGGNIL